MGNFIFKSMEIKWEDIKNNSGGYLYRAKVIGGWLVKLTEDVITYKDDGYSTNNYEYRSSITFVPDSKHEWNNENNN